ncbi:MAG: nuclear transport factor 2 family protein [Bacteroidetes bacterium]|nr:nuclear transport factor 2 family protein [Bacteroidota bacterium]
MKKSSWMIGACLLVMGCVQTRTAVQQSAYNYTPTDRALHDTIVRMDSIFFEAYNNCRLAVMDTMLSHNIEFYHDQGGLSTSQPQLMEALKKNICGKVTRELLPGSIEVYPIAGYGAVEMGLHAFHNNQEPGHKIHFSKFVQIWHKENGQWKITRVISLH